MRNIYVAKTYFEEILMGTNTEGVGFINESARDHLHKAFNFSGFHKHSNHSDGILSVGLLRGNRLEIGIDASQVHTNSYCDCFRNNVCRKLMINEAFVHVVPKKPYYAHLQLVPGKKVGHVNLVGNSYGSLGFFLLPYNNNKDAHIVSNNHVLADSNNAYIGDPIYSLDTNAQKIGVLENYLPICTPGENKLDLAVAQLQGFKSPIPTKSAGYRTPVIGEKVYKYGATTGKTEGIIRSLHYTSKINYGNSAAVFVDQIQIMSTRNGYSFSEGGDSGSVIKSSHDDALVGLLFAGNGNWTLANHQTLVVGQLKNWGYNLK